MASFEQDLIVFEDDTLLVQYTFTDLQGTFSNSWGAYWAAWSYDDWTGARSGSNNVSTSTGPPYTNTPQPDLEKYTAWNVINADAANAGNDTTVLTAPSPINVEIPDGETIVKIYIQQADFLASATGNPPNNGKPWFLATDREYYTELVLSQTKNEGNSVVGATGKLFISSSIFSVANYRPTS